MNIESILKQENGALKNLLQRMAYLNQLNKLLADHLEPNLIRHCRVTQFENGHLVIIAESAIWATRIRFQSPQLIPQLKAYPPLADLKSIECKVAPNVPHRALMAPSSPARKVQKMSKETAEVVLEISKSIKEEKLRKIIEKIAQR